MPHTGGSFIGRSTEIDELDRLLREERWVTLMGPGGCGKSRLAAEYGRRHADAYPGGVYLVECASVEDRGGVAGAVATVFGVRPERADSLPQIVREETSGKPALLIADDCERLVGAVVAVLEPILATAPNVRVVATSRERLYAGAEVAWTIPSLSLATGPADAARSEALQLLVARVRATQPGFRVTDENRSDLVEICRRLDGIPLAIELAAGRMALVPPRQLVAMLDDALSVLGGVHGPARHRTMRATLEWSYELLGPPERETLTALSIFSSPFTLTAAAAMLEADVGTAMDRLSELLDRSLLSVDADRNEALFRQLEPVRQYAQERLSDTPAEPRFRHRHARFVCDQCLGLEPLFVGSAEQEAAFARFSTLLPEIRSALEWCIDNDPAIAVEIGGATGWAWRLGGHSTEGGRMLARLAELEQRGRQAARVLTCLASIRELQRDPEALDVARAAVGAATGVSGDSTRGFALMVLGNVCVSRGDEQGAEIAYAEAGEEADAVGDVLLRAWVAASRANLIWRRGDASTARSIWTEHLPIVRQIGDVWSVGAGMTRLAYFEARGGLLVDARRHAVEAADLLARHRDWAQAPSVLSVAAVIASATGRPREALALLHAEARIRRDLSLRARDADRDIAAARAQLDAAAIEAATALGASLTLPAALELARKVVSSHAHAAERPLSARELEIALLVARGLSNREIAAQVHRSERTVETHVENILRKLDFRSRTQVAAWAVERGIAFTG